VTRNVLVLTICGILLVICALILAQVAVTGLGNTVTVSQQTKNEETLTAETVKVARIIDGDTIVLSDGRRVRYLGINAPEITTNAKKAQCFAQEAKTSNENLVLGKTVRLEKDTTNRDKYGRLLRFVFVNSVGGQEVLVNDYLIRQGFAKVLSIPPDLKLESQFNDALDEAQFNRRGLWEACF
jgi:micrococcal nuclease